MDRSTVLAALRTEGDALTAAMANLADEGFAEPTPCPPWSVADLLAHVLIASSRLPGMLADAAPEGAEVSAADYFRGDRLGGGIDPERIDLAHETAARFTSGREIVTAVGAAVGDMIDRSQAEPPGRLVRTRWGDDMFLTEYIITRVFELAVHGLDLAAALGRPPWITEPALKVCVGLLAGPTMSDQMEALGWDDLLFLQKATGRIGLTPAERGIAPMLLWPRVAA